MSSTISTERLFSLPCFEGLRLFRKYMADHPDLTIPDLLNLIDRVEADAHSLDMEASVYLSELVEKDCPLEGRAFYQTCIKSVLLKHQPIWARLMRQGRQRFVKNLDPDDQDIFVAAGLMENPTPRHVVMWWDSLSGYARLFADRQKIEQGRAAEILSLKHERRRLNDIGIDHEPQWPGFDDNFAGYDVLSYDYREGRIANRLIEVKSTAISPLRFMVTRNEWDKAVQASDAYLFHIWDMKAAKPVLHIRSVAEIAPHIPSDNGKGKWANAQIPVTSQ